MKFTKENTLQLKGIAVIFCCIIIFLIVRVCIRILKCLFSIDRKNCEFAFMVWKELCQFFCIFISVWSRGILYETVRKKGAADGWIKRRLLKLYKGYWFVFVGAFLYVR